MVAADCAGPHSSSRRQCFKFSLEEILGLDMGLSSLTLGLLPRLPSVELIPGQDKVLQMASDQGACSTEVEV